MVISGFKVCLTFKCNGVSLLLIAAANGRPSQNNGSAGGFNRCSQNNGSVGVNRGSSGRSSGGTAEALGCGKTNRGPPNLGDLFAGGIPRLRSSVSSSQLGKCIHSEYYGDLYSAPSRLLLRSAQKRID